MTASTTETATKHSRLRFTTRSLTQNPVVLKELRSRMRGGRAFFLITLYVIMLSLGVSLIYFGFRAANSNNFTSNINQSLGKATFGMIVGLELMMVCFIAPALTAGAISTERERQTFDLLRTTLLPARSLVTGKLTSALFFLVLLLVVGLPLQSMAYLFGGVALEEVIISFLMLIVTAGAFSAIGLYISSRMKSTLPSTVVSYIATILIVFGIPIIIYISLITFASLLLDSGNLSNFQQTLVEVILLSVGWVFVSVNPLAAAIGSELMLIEEQNVFFMKIPLTSGTQFPLVAPWIGFVLFYLLLSLLLVFLSIRHVKRVEQ